MKILNKNQVKNIAAGEIDTEITCILAGLTLTMGFNFYLYKKYIENNKPFRLNDHLLEKSKTVIQYLPADIKNLILENSQA